MTAKRTGAHVSKRNWAAIEDYVVYTPGATLTDAAEHYNISLRSMYAHGGPSTGNWEGRQHERLRAAAQTMSDHVVAVLSEGRGDDAQALSAIQVRLQRIALQLAESLYPPPDASVEVLHAAEERLAGLSAKDRLRAFADIARTLTETGRHLRLLAGQSTEIFERIGAPGVDVYIPATLEDAKRAEMLSRTAQQALRATIAGEPIDIEGALVSPAAVHPLVAAPRGEPAPTGPEVGL